MTQPLTRSSLGEKFSEGARLMWAILEKRDWDQATCERELSLPKGYANRLLYGDRRPGLEMALRIEELTKIPARSWLINPKKAFELPAREGTDPEAA